MALERKRPGDPLSILARDWDTIGRTTDIVLGNQAWQSGGPIQSAGDVAIFQVLNSSGANVDRHGVLGIDSMLVTPGENADEFATRPSFVGVTPADADVGRFGVLLEPIADGTVGHVCLLGCVVALLEVAAESDTHAEVISGNSAKLGTGKYGSARILWKPSGTGELLGVVRIGHDPGPGVRPFTFTGPMGESPLASNEANVTWNDSLGGTGVVVDRYTEWANAEADQNGHAAWINRRWEIIGVKQCEAAT